MRGIGSWTSRFFIYVYGQGGQTAHLEIHTDFLDREGECPDIRTNSLSGKNGQFKWSDRQF